MADTFFLGLTGNRKLMKFGGFIRKVLELRKLDSFLLK